MIQKSEKIKYFLYARKSTESEDRQVASIEAQVKELSDLAEKENLEIIEILSESYSAKAPGRKVFNEMLERVYKGEARGILCWKLNRLARNPVDGGQINWMLQNSLIQHIRTHDRSYHPTDNVLMMSVEFGMANQFIVDLRSDTKRGLKTRANNGWFPGEAPIGYLNDKYQDKGKRIIKIDPERFELVKKLWSLLLDDGYSIKKIFETAQEWGLTTKRHKKTNKPISRTQVYRIFENPFYCGKFEYPKGSGNWYQGKHKSMITEEEFARAQFLIDSRSKIIKKEHNFDFGHELIKCGECGCSIIGEEKIKRQKNGNIHRYVFYRCHNSRRKDRCSQNKYIDEKELKRQIIEVLESIEIPSEFRIWAMEVIREENHREVEDREVIIKSQRKHLDESRKKIDRLIDMRANGEIESDIFEKKKEEELLKQAQLKELINDTNHNFDNWLENIERLFIFAEKSKERFENGDTETRRLILGALCQNLFLKEKKISLDVEKPLIEIKKAYRGILKENIMSEPLKSEMNKRPIKILTGQNCIGGG